MFPYTGKSKCLALTLYLHSRLLPRPLHPSVKGSKENQIINSQDQSVFLLVRHIVPYKQVPTIQLENHFTA